MKKEMEKRNNYFVFYMIEADDIKTSTEQEKEKNKYGCGIDT